MTRSQQNSSLVTLGLAIAASLCILLGTAIAAQAQTFQVLHNFTGGTDGAGPLDGLTIDRNGNLYGTASAGGNRGYGCTSSYGFTGCGTVFELARSGTGWILRPLYDFKGGNDPGNPGDGVAFGPDGALYGVTNSAGGCSNYNVCGNVFRLAPPPTFCASFRCSWQETVLHQFTGQPDGSYPANRVLFDPSGNMYGLTDFGGTGNIGATYELTRSGGSWSESVIYSFTENSQGYGVYFPGGSMAIDPAGNLYAAAACSTTLSCFYGAVFQLQPLQSGWTLNELYDFNGYNGYEPGGVIRDSSGNLYGATFGDGGNQSAAVYELSPSNGGWNYTQLYNYGGFGEANTAVLVMDSAGNLYGANSITGYGSIFKLTPSGNGWIFSTLHTFSGPDGEGATGTLVLDGNGNLYGTTVKGGAYGYGVIWEITP